MKRTTVIRIRLVCIAAGLIPASQLHAQVTYDGCFDPHGVAVASILTFQLQNVASAGRAQNGAPVIYYNPNVLVWFQPITRLFWYMHECGHHALGHTLGRVPIHHEQEADCWGIRTMVQLGMVNAQGVQVIQADLSRVAGSWTHLPGPQRAINLVACLS